MQKRGPRLVWISLAVVVVLVASGYVGVSVWIHNYLRSPQFLSLVSAKTSDAFRAQATYAPLSWQGSTVYSDSLVATGNPGAIVKEIRADQVRADVNWRAMWDGAWRLEQVDVLNFDGTFHPGSPEGGRDPANVHPPVHGMAAWLPRRFELGELKIAQAHVGFLTPEGIDIVDMKNSSLLVKPEGIGWTVDGAGGVLNVPHIPELAITNFRTRMQGGAFFLSDAALRLGETGKIKASGEFAGDSKVVLDWSQVDVGEFLTPAWKTRVSGNLAGTGTIQWPANGGLPMAKADGSFRVTDGMLQNFPLLDQIASFTQAPQFKHMPLQELSGKYQWAAGKLALSNLVLESKGLLRIEGECFIAADGALQGTLQVGVTPQTLQWLPGSRERVFTVNRNSYVWTEVHLSGSTSNIQEDLTSRLKSAAKDEVIDQGTKLLDQLPIPGAAKDGAKEGAKGVLDILTPLIP
ncbi:hypothetical protein BH09VER1_BH09VER1_42670 [soil metagenome]